MIDERFVILGALLTLLGSSSYAIASVPTLIKSYRNPETESWFVSFCGGVSALITLLCVKSWDLAHVGFPLYIFIICSIFVVLVKGRVGVRWKAAPQALDTKIAGE